MKREKLERAVDSGEERDGNIEFKYELEKDIHLHDGKRESLIAQMKYRVQSGNGEATYVIGVSDDGDIKGLQPDRFSETIDVLSVLAEEAELRINDVDTWEVDGNRIVGLVYVDNQPVEKQRENDLIVGTAGHVDHGKSTLVGTLITGKPDNGEGEIRSYLDVKPHELERGLSADLSYALLGYKDGTVQHLENPNRDTDRSELVETSDKIVSFVDTVGHKPWLRTTIRGLLGQKIDYGLLVVSAADGPTETTKEHLGLLVAADIPVIIAITKTDLVSDEKVTEAERQTENIVRQAGKTPISVKRHNVETAVDEINEDIYPIVQTSAVTKDGIDHLENMFQQLEPTETSQTDEPVMYIDKIYNIDGVGPVISGSIQNGTVEVGDNLLIGPFSDGSYKETTAKSIEVHYYDVDSVSEGQIASIAVSNVQPQDLERGMVVLPQDSDPQSAKKFRAEMMILNHPTKITEGYEPVIHVETISESAVITPDKNQMTAGDKSNATIEFKFDPHYVEEGQTFIFREGRSKGVGKITEIIE